MKFNIFFVGLIVFSSSSCFAVEKTTIRIGVLPFGTVNWELSVLQAKSSSADLYQLDIQFVANPQAGKVALQSGAVDMIVSDWIWVSKQRSIDSDLTFYPYSNTAGALVVPAASNIRDLQSLKGKKLGIAGGELDKNWLLLQALALNKYQFDLNQSVEKIYAAPPLLNQQILQQRVDAVINYWHYAARLEAQGFRQIIDGQEIQQQLGIPATVPSLGYVFKQSWGNNHYPAIKRFFQDTRIAKESICTDDAAWQRIIPLTRIQDPKTQQILRKRYCAGRVNSWGLKEQQAAAQIYSLLRKLSNNRLTGTAEKITPGTFWSEHQGE
jgi:NitT/TauT family transport system substrate-binding protein